MAVSHAPLHTHARYHYARLLLTPLAPSTDPVDVPVLVAFFAQTTSDWFGTVGGPVGLSDVDVVLVEPSQATEVGARESVIRFPAGATHALLTALPLSPLPGYRVAVLSDAADVARLAGAAGRGRRGYAAWVDEVRARSSEREGEAEEAVGADGDGMHEG